MFVLSAEDLRCPKTGKQAYPSEERAAKVLEVAWTRKLDDQPRPQKMPCRPYLCEECGWWHLTSHWDWEEA